MRILQLLSGEKYVELVPGTADRDELPEDAVIEPAQDPRVAGRRAAEAIAENINDISVSLKNILQLARAGEGLLGQMITDPDFGKEGLEAFWARR